MAWYKATFLNTWNVSSPPPNSALSGWLGRCLHLTSQTSEIDQLVSFFLSANLSHLPPSIWCMLDPLMTSIQPTETAAEIEMCAVTVSPPSWYSWGWLQVQYFSFYYVIFLCKLKFGYVGRWLIFMQPFLDFVQASNFARIIRRGEFATCELNLRRFLSWCFLGVFLERLASWFVRLAQGLCYTQYDGYISCGASYSIFTKLILRVKNTSGHLDRKYVSTVAAAIIKRIACFW